VPQPLHDLFERGVADIFVSFSKSDRQWAHWIAQELTALDHEPHVHDWEIGPGEDIVGASDCSRWHIILSRYSGRKSGARREIPRTGLRKTRPRASNTRHGARGRDNASGRTHAFEASFGEGRSLRNRRLRPKTASSRLPPVRFDSFAPLSGMTAICAFRPKTRVASGRTPANWWPMHPASSFGY
jgi:hypothetical protein